MSHPVRPQRPYRLALALTISTGLHLMAAALAQRGAPLEPVPLPGVPLHVRLDAPAAAPAPAPAPEPAAAPVAASGAVQQAASAASSEAAPAAPAGAAGSGVPGAATGAGEQLDLLAEVQLRYATSLPPSATVEYDVSAGGSASLRWEIGEDARYRLTLDGPGGQEAGSSGIVGDAGIAPEQAWEGNARLRFDRDARTLASNATARSYRIIDSALDPWSVLMQLCAVGAASPERLRSPVVFFVGGPQGVATVRFEPAGSAEIATALGPIAAVHLVQTAPAGSGRLEVWLAPQRHYLPVQLRRVAPDGSVVTHTARAITLAPGSPD